MMKMKESKFGAPAGIYTSKFLGIMPMKQDKPRMGRDNKPMQPGVEWQFEILDGEQKGQIIGRITAAEPTTKNSCGVLLAGLVGRVVKEEEVIDDAAYVGLTYQAVVGPSKEDPNKTYVVQIVPRHGAQQPAVPAPAAPPAGRAAPPPARPAPAAPGAAPPPAVAVDYWVQTPAMAAPELVNGAKLQSMLDLCKTPAEVDAVLVMDANQTTGWKPPSHFSLKPSIPF